MSLLTNENAYGTEASIISKRNRKSNTLTLERFNRSLGAPVLFGILFFFVLCLGEQNSLKRTVMVLAVFMLLVIAVRFKVLRDRISLPFIALTLYVIMDGVSTFYAVSGKFALREFLKVFLAYLLAVILLATSPKKEALPGKRIATILAVCTTVGSLVGIDMVSTGWISGIVLWIVGRFTEAYQAYEGLQSLSRMASIFTNANVFAGFSGLGILLTLGLADVSSARRERCLYLVMLYLQAVAFLLTISLGAFVFAFVALIVFVLLHNRENRIQALALMLEMLILAAAAAVFISRLNSGDKPAFHAFPLLCTAFGAALLCVIDRPLMKMVESKTMVHTKAAAVIGSALIVLVIAYALASLNLTWPITIPENGSVERVVLLPDPGPYSVDIQSQGDSLELRVRTQTLQETGRNVSTTVYSGSAYDATFTIPEGSTVAYFVFSAPEGARITSARFGGNRIPLDYKLLPDFITRRLISRYSVHSAGQRLVYFDDGLKLFRRSPVVGLGMGAFENGIKSVQTYYYETKYAHNHYFQTMLETGVLGLLLFLSLLLVSAAAVLRSGKEHRCRPMLFAAVVFMAGQALHDIVFSSYVYLPVAYGTFAVISLSCGEAIRKPKLTKAARTVVIGIVSVCSVVYCGFLAGNMIAKQQADNNPTFQTLVQSEKLDRFEWADYALPYVVNATGENINPYVLRQADVYAERLAEVDSNTIPIYLAEYYFNTGRIEPGIAMVEKYVDYVSSDQTAWQRAVDLLQAYADDSEVFRNGVIRIAGKLDRWNEENLGSIQLSKEADAFLHRYTAE